MSILGWLIGGVIVGAIADASNEAAEQKAKSMRISRAEKIKNYAYWSGTVYRAIDNGDTYIKADCENHWFYVNPREFNYIFAIRKQNGLIFRRHK